jgi:hypothetical protein
MEKDKAMTVLETIASQESLDFRLQLARLYKETNIPTEELMCNLGLFLRSGALVKYLVINEIYEMILDVPGNIMEFGVWWGQNLVFFENLRAIYEPFNKNRRIIGFDTFEGYKNISENDAQQSDIFFEGNFSSSSEYKDQLAQIIELHEKINVLGHIYGRHKLVAGDCCETVPNYFREYPDEIISLAYLDVGLYKPTKIILENVLPHLVKGSLIVMDELNWQEAPGERMAYKEVLKNVDHDIFCSRYTKERVYIRIK